MEYRWYITPEDYKLAKNNGINRKILNSRVRSYGWDIKRACTEPMHGQFLKNILTNEIYQNLKKYNISLNVFRGRLRIGWSARKASTTPCYSMLESLKAARLSRRVITDEQYQRAEQNGIARGTLKQRVCCYNWEIEKAINTPIMTRRQCAELINKSRNFGRAFS